MVNVVEEGVVFFFEKQYKQGFGGTKAMPKLELSELSVLVLAAPLPTTQLNAV